MKKPTASQLIMLRRMADAGGRIFRVPGGSWTVEGVATRAVPGVREGSPTWSVPVQTLRGAEKGGFVRRAFVHPEEWRDERVLTDEGRAAAATTEAPKLTETLRRALFHMEGFTGTTYHVEELASLGYAEKTPDGWVLTEAGKQVARQERGR